MVIHAKKGIILNTGGFSHNRRMREENQPKPASVDWTLANPGDTGEMIEMAKALGAATDLMDASWWLPETTLPENVRLYLVPELRSEEHTSELQSLMRISYAVFCLKKNNEHTTILISSSLPEFKTEDTRTFENYIYIDNHQVQTIQQDETHISILQHKDTTTDDIQQINSIVRKHSVCQTY